MMSRSGYSDDYDDPRVLIMWRGAVASAIKGKRGQTFLKALLAALDTMEHHRLIADDLIHDGEVCAIGALGVALGIDMDRLDPEDSDAVASTFGIAPALAREVVYENDEGSPETPEARYVRMREWIKLRIKDV